MADYIEFKCKCGRTLRVKQELAETVVRCWDCHAEQTVPRARRAARLASETYSEGLGVLEASTLLWITLWALGMCAVLVAPWAGLVLMLVPLAMAGMGVRGALRGGGWKDETTVWVGPIAAGLAIGLVLAAPVLVRHGLADSVGLPLPMPGPSMLALAIVCWVIAPLLFALLCAPSPRAAALAYVRHPVATGLLILFVPFCLVAMEATAVTTSSLTGWLNPFVADLMPPPNHERWAPVHAPEVPLFPEALSRDEILYDYRHGLTHGYTLAGSVVASIPRGIRTRIYPRGDLPASFAYLGGRLVFGCITLLLMGVFFMVQARWFDLIVRIDQRQHARPPEHPPASGSA